MRRVSQSYRPQSRRQMTVSEFRGVDLVNSPTNVAPSRSPSAPNMIRDVPGKVRKRTGFFTVAHYPARINGVHRLAVGGSVYELVHAGDALYLGELPVYSGVRDVRSKAFQLEDKLYLLDGKTFLCFDGQEVSPVSAHAYVPTIVLSRAPAGGGRAHEGVNLLGSRWIESFLSDGSAATYQLSFDALDDDIAVEVMETPDVWTTQTRGAHYSFDPMLGSVTFVAGSIPEKSPIDGADNVRITACKTRADYVARIDGCDMGVLFGVGGAADRLFVTGSEPHRNRDWFSGLADPTYFPLGNYNILGQSTRVMGYSIIGDRLAAHKQNDEDGRNIVLRAGTLVDDKAAFPVVGTLQGAGTQSGHTVAYLKTEPLFFSHSGIFAITPADVSGERYTQNRSYFINPALVEEPGGEEAVAVSHNDFYMLALGGKIYVLDSLLKSYEDGAPYSTHQYECFVLTGIDARVLYKAGERLRFGTSGGDIMEFYADARNPASYTDNGAPIAAWWDTPMLAGDNFYMCKGFKYLALKLSAAPETGAEVFVQLRGVWSKLFEEFSRLRYFCFSSLRFSRFTFSGDSTPKAFGRKLTLPKTDKAQFRFQNQNGGEPFGLYNYAIEFRQNGRIR